MTDRVRVLLVVKGHPYQRQPFYDVFDADAGVEWTLVEHPAARALFHPDRAGESADDVMPHPVFFNPP